MARGRLRCLGTSLRLKARFGSGYRVSIRVQGGTAFGGSTIGGTNNSTSSGSSTSGWHDAGEGKDAAYARAGLLPTDSGEIQPAPPSPASVVATSAAAPAGEVRQRNPAAAAQAAGVRALFAQALGLKPSEHSSTAAILFQEAEHQAHL
jgi:hypothetical protein